MHKLHSLALTCVVILLSALQNAQAAPAVVGQPAPEFSLSNAAGQPVTLSQFKGSVVVLEWFNQGCPFVKKFYQNRDMTRLQTEARAKGVVWLTINSSAEGKSGYIDPSEALEVANAHGLDPKSLLLDPQGITGLSYGARVTPHMFVIDSKGMLAYAGAIDSSPTTRSSDIANSTNYVAQALDALAAGRAPSPATTEPYGCGVKYK
jgi:peroxiredoxin